MNFNSMLTKLKRDAENSAVQSQSQPKKRARTEELESKIDNRRNNNYLHLPFPKRKVSKIYLACPPNVQTGGPEAMHQLCHKINSLQVGDSTDSNNVVDAFMLFLREDNTTHELPRAFHVKNAAILPPYRSTYCNLKVAESCPSLEGEIGIGDDIFSDSLIIWPECWTHLIDSLVDMKLATTRKRYQNCIWWLSVDNNNSKYKDWSRKDVLHLYQSEYAKNYVLNNLRKISSLKPNQETYFSNVQAMTEFIPDRRQPHDMTQTRDLQVLYNPFKGIHYTDEIRRRSGTKFKFTPIGPGPHVNKERLSPEEVTTLLHRARVYIDFGPHPGMDRLPREAAMAGLIVITNQEGAAFYHNDVPISTDYKIKSFDVEKVHKLLKECLEGYDEKLKDFDSYIKWINGQEGTMEKCVKEMLNALTENRPLVIS